MAYTNPLIDSFCIVSGDSDYTPLVGRLKSMGKHVLGISRSEAASGIFVNACNEFVFLESVAKRPPKKAKKQENSSEDGDINALVSQVETVVGDQDEEQMYASELKNTLLRLRPDFGKLVEQITKHSDKLISWTENSALVIGLEAEPEEKEPKLDKNNWLPAFEQALEHFKDEGFERVNPSILKATIQADYPSFEEKQIGFKRFSDVMKALEKKGLLVIEMDDAHTMLLRIC